jgi:hypothetical protein
VRPLVSVLTTGSRSGDDRGRVDTSRRLARGAGCPTGRLFGAVVDRDLYRAVAAGDAEPFRAWTDGLADDLCRHRVELLVVDAWQLFSVTHDLVHVMGRVAAARAGRALGRPVAVLQMPVVPAVKGISAVTGAPAMALRLTAAELAAKRAAAASHPDIAKEVAEIVALEGEAAVAVETLYEPPPLARLLAAPARPPAYERYGEERIAAGVYAEVIRWRHVVPLLAALAARAHSAGAPACAS